jgi:hypothetical protein
LAITALGSVFTVEYSHDQVRCHLAGDPKRGFARGGKALLGIVRQHPAHDLNLGQVIVNKQQANVTR